MHSHALMLQPDNPVCVSNTFVPDVTKNKVLVNILPIWDAIGTAALSSFFIKKLLLPNTRQSGFCFATSIICIASSTFFPDEILFELKYL